VSLSFASPWLLLLLVLPAALLRQAWRRQASIVLPLDASLEGARPARAWRVALDLADALPPLVLAVAIVLLAGPERTGQPTSRRSLVNIELCIDVSGSMTATYGGSGTRYDAAMKAISDFTGKRQGDAFGLTAFGNSVLHWVPLTSDVSAIRCAAPFLQPDALPWWFGGTEIGKALRACRKVLLSRESGDRMIILLTDGYSADLDDGKDVEVARQLAADGIVVYTIHVAEGGPPAEMGTIASITGGEVFEAGDPAALAAVFARIDAMNPAKLERKAPETFDAYEPWCVAGLALLGASLLCGFGLRAVPW
jgi:Ca-activated chloride channel family protein